MAELKVIDSRDSEDTIVTETMIVGVTESGIIRKRSVKRRISRDDGGHKDRKYGHNKEEYAKISERVLADRAIASAVEVLQERWRMIMYMHDDCMELVKQWEEQRLEKRQRKRNRRMLLLAFASAPILLIVFAWMLARMLW